MIKYIHRSMLKVTITLLLIASLISLAASPAAAHDDSDGKNKEIASEACAAKATEPVGEGEAARQVASEPASINVSYVLYSGAIKLKAEPEQQPVSVFRQVMMSNVSGPASIIAAAKPFVIPAVSTAPMTAGEKAQYWLTKSFKPPGPYAQSIFSGLYNELLDNNEGKEDTLDDLFADAMTRAARSFGFRITSGFFEKFAYASLFRQDPRYHRSGKTSAGAKLGYAVSRVFITQGDRGGDQFNISYLGGGLTAAFISNAWQREEKKGTGQAFRRWGTHIAMTALSNILREFIGGQ